MSKKSPQLRFEGFTDDWEDRELGEEFKKVSERNDGSFGRDHWISVAKMYFQSPEKVQSNNIDTRTYVMREGDIAFEGHPNSEFKFGRFVANDIGAGVVSELFPIYKHQHEYDNNYWKNAIQIERIMAPIFAKSITSSGNSSNKLDTKHFLRQKILIPQINEQKKMGSFFKQLDNTIALHQRKLDLLKEQKKGYLQKMFPKNGAKVPELRFAGFADDWEERKLIDVKDNEDRYSYTGGPFGSDLKSSDYTEIGVRIIQLQNIGDGKFVNDYKIYTSEEKARSLNSNLIYPGEIIIAKMADPLARATILPKIEPKYLMASDGIRLKINTDYFDNYYILTLINSDVFRKEALNNSTGTTRKRIGLVTLGNLPMMIPSFEEQQKIGSFFKQLDDTIALHQRKLDLLKEQKKGFLQKMFV